MEFSLREYQPEDFEVLWRIDQKCFAPGIAYTRRELGVYIRRRSSFTIVAEGGQPPDPELQRTAGFIVAEARRGQGHILTIDVLPGSQRSGLGTNLLRAAEQRLRELACNVLVLETAVDNAAAQAFYKRHGYAVLRVMPRYYPNGVDALVMVKELAAVVEAAAR